MSAWQCVGREGADGGGRVAGALVLALGMLAAATPSALAGGDTTSGLPIPRFVSIKTDRVNVRGGPDKDHDVAWIYTRVGWPVEITAEFENWRRIRDSDGTEGWVYHSLLSGKRTAVVQLKAKTDLAPLHAKPDADSAGDCATAIGRARIGQKLQWAVVPSGGRRLRRLDRAEPAVGRLSGREDRVRLISSLRVWHRPFGRPHRMKVTRISLSPPRGERVGVRPPHPRPLRSLDLSPRGGER